MIHGYKRSLHDSKPYAARIVEDLKFEGGTTLSAGVASYFLEHPNQYPWNNSFVGCLPTISYGGRWLVRLEVTSDRVQVHFVVVRGETTGKALYSRAALILDRAVQQLELTPVSSAPPRNRLASGPTWAIHATETEHADGSTFRFWYVLGERPRQLVDAS